MVSEASPRQEDLEELNFYSYQMVQNWFLFIFTKTTCQPPTFSLKGSPGQDGFVEILRSSNRPSVQEL